MKLEGILLAKTPFKEKDLICKFLLRNGELFSAYFYGGQGSEKKRASTILEVGHFLKLTLSATRKDRQSELQIAKEWEIVWHSENIRKNYKAFYLMNFYNEFLIKISTHFDHKNEFSTKEHQGIFKVLSNSLFFMDKSLEKKQFVEIQHLFLFLSKISVELGIVPQLNSCLYCECELEGLNALIFDVKDGGFVCHNCGDQRFEGDIKSSLVDGYNAFINLKYSLNNKFENYAEIKADMSNVKDLYHYICYQFGIKPESLKSYSVVF